MVSIQEPRTAVRALFECGCCGIRAEVEAPGDMPLGSRLALSCRSPLCPTCRGPCKGAFFLLDRQNPAWGR